MPISGAAAARLFDDHVNAVYALVTRRVGPASSSGITGEVFEQAARSWDRFDSNHGTERLFLFGIAMSVLRRHGDTEREHLLQLRPRVEEASPNTDPLVSIHGRDDEPEPPREDDEVTDLMRAVVDLAPDDRDILLLSTWEGCSHADIAEALDLPTGTVRSSLNRIRRDLKKALAAAGSSDVRDSRQRQESP